MLPGERMAESFEGCSMLLAMAREQREEPLADLYVGVQSVAHSDEV